LSAQLQNTLPGSGVYSGNGTSPTGSFDPKTAGAGSHSIVYTYTGDNGCASSISQTVIINPTPIADAGPDKTVLEGGYVVMSPTLVTGIPVTYTWTPATYLNDAAIAKPQASPPTDFTYTLTVTSDKGCTTSDDVFIKLLKDLTIPNIFSPNGDGIHDTWVIEHLDSYPGCEVQIYNRYGQMVQRFVNYTTPWDGRINGREAPVGTYYYIIDPKNGRKPRTGFVDIIR
jgi:gliding motility-associated-like protein